MLAAVGVVAAHTEARGLDVFGCLCVPIFAIISSTFFFKKFDLLTEEKERRQYLKHFLSRIFYLYLFWQILYLPLAFKAWISLDKENSSTPPQKLLIYIYRFIFPGHDVTKDGTFIAGTNGWGASWYLIALLMGIPLFCLLLKYTGLIFTGCVSLILEIVYILSDGYQFATHLYVWGLMCFPRLFIYFFIGKLVAAQINKGHSYKTSRLLLFSVFSLVLFTAECFLIGKLGGSYASGEKIMVAPTSAALVLTAFNLNSINFDTRKMRGFSTFLYTSQAYSILVASFFVTNGWLKLIVATVLSLIGYELYLLIRHWTHWRVLNYAI